MKKIFLSLLIMLIILGIVISTIYFTSTKQPTSNLTQVSLSEVTRSVFYAPQYVALSQGFFEEEGLSIELSTAQGADSVMTSVLSGNSDIRIRWS